MAGSAQRAFKTWADKKFKERRLKRRRNKTHIRLKGDAKRFKEVHRRYTGSLKKTQRRTKGGSHKKQRKLTRDSKEARKESKRSLKEAARKFKGGSRKIERRPKNEEYSNEAQRSPKRAHIAIGRCSPKALAKKKKAQRAHRNYKEMNKVQTGRTLKKKVGRGKQLTKDPQRSAR